MKTLTILLTLSVALSYAQVGLNNPNPDPSSILDLNANNKGLLIPRMSSAERVSIPSPGNGLMVYDTDQQGFFYHSAGTWYSISGWVKNAVGNNVSLSGNASISGTVSTNNLNVPGFATNALIPSGGIIMWNGSTPPSGWVLCDGNNGTPDLRDRFIVGQGGSYSVGNTGGAATVALSVAQLPSHVHTGTTTTTGAHTHPHEDDFSYVDTGWNNQYPGSYLTAVGVFSGQGTSEGPSNRFAGRNKNTSSSGNHSHTFTSDATGSGSSIENRPPYYALAFIMKQ